MDNESKLQYLKELSEDIWSHFGLTLIFTASTIWWLCIRSGPVNWGVWSLVALTVFFWINDLVITRSEFLEIRRSRSIPVFTQETAAGVLGKLFSGPKGPEVVHALTPRDWFIIQTLVEADPPLLTVSEETMKAVNEDLDSLTVDERLKYKEEHDELPAVTAVRNGTPRLEVLIHADLHALDTPEPAVDILTWQVAIRAVHSGFLRKGD